MRRSGIKLARKIAGTKAMQRVTSREMHPGAQLQVSLDLRLRVQKFQYMCNLCIN